MALRMEVQRTIKIATGRTPLLIAALEEDRFAITQGSSRINIGMAEYDCIGDAIEALNESNKEDRANG